MALKNFIISINTTEFEDTQKKEIASERSFVIDPEENKRFYSFFKLFLIIRIKKSMEYLICYRDYLEHYLV